MTWEVFNPNSINVFYIYATWSNNPRQQDTLIATPGASSFVTNLTTQDPFTPFDDNTTGIWWIDENLTPDQPFDVFGDRGNEVIDLSEACSTANRVVAPVAPFASPAMFKGQLAGIVNIVLNPTNIDDAIAEQVQVGPNPTHDRIFIQGGDLTGKVTVKVLDTFGKQVLVSSFQISGKNEISLQGLPAGMYVLELNHNQFRKSIRVIKR
ncbi:MAG: T9SS type A sorting domain-containing protein [Bacteroidia bacterium]|nr:T9SS type A sorting domain-containing protein [Bacteroidia bacterium]